MTDPAGRVAVAYLSPALLHAAFHDSLFDLIAYDTARHRRVKHRLHIQAGANLSMPRNDLVDAFLRRDGADWLWLVDSDMTFPPDTVERLLDRADPATAPVVGGLCFGQADGRVVPMLFGLGGASEQPRVVRHVEWPTDALMPVFATGAACLLIHRDVLEKVQGAGFSRAYPWFQESELDGAPVSEDITFCVRAGQCGFPVHVDTGVRLGHVKDRVLDVDAYLAQGGGDG